MDKTENNNANPQEQDNLEIRALVNQFVEGWNSADGSTCARPFAENADFTAINGLRAESRELIGQGHAEILSTIFLGTTLRARVNSVRYLRSDVAVADVTMWLTPAGQTWLPKYSSCGIVATKDAGAWSIAVFRNMIPFERPMAGQLDRQFTENSKPQEVPCA